MSLADVIRLARRNLLSLILVPLVAMLAVGAWSYLAMPNWYTATTSLVVTVESNDQAVTASKLRAASLLADDFAEMAQDPQIKREVADSLGLANIEEYSIRVQIAENTRIIYVAVTGHDPTLAAAVANTLTDVFNQKAGALLGWGGVSVISSAQPPTKASGPSRKIYCAGAFAAVFAVMLVWLVAREMAQNKVRGGKDVEALLDKPVIGRVPTCR